MMVLFWVEVGKSFCTKELELPWLRRRLKTSGPSAVANVGTPFNQQHDNFSDYQRRHTLTLQNACIRILAPCTIEINYTISSMLDSHFRYPRISLCLKPQKGRCTRASAQFLYTPPSYRAIAGLSMASNEDQQTKQLCRQAGKFVK
jgi:hypothetical protein